MPPRRSKWLMNKDSLKVTTKTTTERISLRQMKFKQALDLSFKRLSYVKSPFIPESLEPIVKLTYPSRSCSFCLYTISTI